MNSRQEQSFNFHFRPSGEPVEGPIRYAVGHTRLGEVTSGGFLSTNGNGESKEQIEFDSAYLQTAARSVYWVSTEAPVFLKADMTMYFNVSDLDSPLGTLLLVTDEQTALRALDFAGHESHLHRTLSEQYGQYELADVSAPREAAEALARYFDGDLQALDQLAVVTRGTEFQERVWRALRRIPAGATTSYGKLAKSLGLDEPCAAIDVGAANAANPVAVVVPCHRVVASDGHLKGYAWGLHRKRWLLDHEKAIPAQLPVQQVMTLPGF